MSSTNDYGEECMRNREPSVAFVSPPSSKTKPDLTKDSGDGFLGMLGLVAEGDVTGLKRAQQSYGNSWKRRGGVGAFMMLSRKWDRLELQAQKIGYDIFNAVAEDQRSEGIIDDIRDLRRYLMLVEAELLARGFDAAHRDNK